MTNEELKGLPKQPPNTCPMIDDCIDILYNINNAIRGFTKAGEEELREMVEYVDWNIDFRHKLEEIRTNAELIRDWGQSWKELALSLEKK